MPKLEHTPPSLFRISISWRVWVIDMTQNVFKNWIACQELDIVFFLEWIFFFFDWSTWVFLSAVSTLCSSYNESSSSGLSSLRGFSKSKSVGRH
jgi:hypothetical protein